MRLLSNGLTCLEKGYETKLISFIEEYQLTRFEEPIVKNYVLNGKYGRNAVFPIRPISQLARRADVWFIEEKKGLCYDFA